MKHNLESCIAIIQDPNIQDFVRILLETAPSEFYTDPCSGTGQHHPPEDQQVGGILIHTKKAVQVALSLMRFYGLDQGQKEYWLLRDQIIAAVILHDLYKNGIPWGKSTHPEHGDIAAKELEKWARRTILPIQCTDFIADLVRYHMGQWTKPDSKMAIVVRNIPSIHSNLKLDSESVLIAHLIVQTADYLASRKWCPFTIDQLDPLG